MAKRRSDEELEAERLENERQAKETGMVLEVALLKERVKAGEDECGRHIRDNKELQEKLEQQRADQADIYYYLHQKLDDNYDVIANLERQILVEQTDRERTERQYETTIEEQKTKFDSELQTLSEKLHDAEETLLTLGEFRENKQELEDRLLELEGRLKQEQDSFQTQIAELDRRNVQEKERLKKEMLLKIKETKQNLVSMTEDQLHTTTKRTIMENEQMITELQYQSKETEKLLHKNQQLTQENLRLQRDLELNQAAEKELAKRTHFYQKLIKKLHEKLKVKEDGDREVEAGKRDEERQRVEAEREQFEMVNALQEKVDRLEAQLEDVCTELEQTRHELEAGQGEQERMLSLQDETVKFLLLSMEDAMREAHEQRTGGAAADDEPPVPAPTSVDELTPSQRQAVMRALLTKLHAYQSAAAGEGEQPLRDAREAQDRQLLEATLGVSLPPINASRPQSQEGAGAVFAAGSGAAAAAQQQQQQGGGGVELWPFAKPRRPSRQRASPRGVSVAVQTDSSSQSLFFSDRLGHPTRSPTHLSRGQGGSVDPSLRPWGKAASNLPTAQRSSKLFLRRGDGKKMSDAKPRGGRDWRRFVEEQSSPVRAPAL